MLSSPTSPTKSPDVRSNGLPDVAFIGKAGSGKSTAAELFEQLGWQRHSFAAALKDVAAFLWNDAARTDREKLQNLGVDVRKIDPDTWVNILMRKFDDESGPIVVDDCRFPNEYWALKGAGFTIVRIRADRALRIDRLRTIGKLQDESQLEHESETAIDDLTADRTLSNYDGYMDYCKTVAVLAQRLAR